MVLIAAAIICLVAIFYFIFIRNSLVALTEQVERAWANIDVILKQRFEEIQQLIQVVEQYTQNENSVLKKVIEARQKYGTASSFEQKVSSAQEMESAFKGLLALAEAYPDLKSNQNFLQLQGRISQIEETLSDRREHYNDFVTSYNTRINQIPDSFVAQKMKLTRKPLFQVSDSEKALPNLKMNLGA